MKKHLYKLYDFFEDLPIAIKNVGRGFKNLKSWFKLIWKNRDWDWGFLFDILIFKFECMLEYFKNSSIIVQEEVNEICSQLDRVIYLARRIKNESYADDLDRDFKERFGVSYYSLFGVVTRDKVSMIEFSGSEEQGLAYTELRDKWNREHEEEIEEFFNIIKNNFRSWWD